MLLIIRSLYRNFNDWERYTKVSFLMACFLLLVGAGVAVIGPVEVRPWILAGCFLLLLVAQMIFMWANRRMLSVFTQAQRLYLDEDFEAACTLLQALYDAGQARPRELALLGNAYRQRGLLSQSEAVFQASLVLGPQHHFSLYGFGRTLLVMGRYDEAVQVFRQALDIAPTSMTQLSLAEALFRQGQLDAAVVLAQQVCDDLHEAPYRLLAQYIMVVAGQGTIPESVLLSDGLAYWQAQAIRYGETAYGQSLADDVRAMEIMLKET